MLGARERGVWEMTSIATFKLSAREVAVGGQVRDPGRLAGQAIQLKRGARLAQQVNGQMQERDHVQPPAALR